MNKQILFASALAVLGLTSCAAHARGTGTWQTCRGMTCHGDRYLAGLWRQPISNTMLKHQGSRGEPPLNNTPSAWSVRRDYLMVSFH